MANSTTLIASTVMDAAAVLMNDAAKTQFTYAIQIPYLNMALRDLQEIFEQNEIPVTTEGSANITIPAGTDHLAFSDTNTPPCIPQDLIEPSVLWERQAGINPYTLMTKVDFLDLALSGQEIQQFIWYTWESQEFRFFAANQDNDIKMTYIKSIFNTITSGSDSIGVINSLSYLQYRTARHLASYIAENPSRAEVLAIDATEALDKVLGIGTKGRQLIVTRRRPFRAAYKRGTYM